MKLVYFLCFIAILLGTFSCNTNTHPNDNQKNEKEYSESYLLSVSNGEQKLKKYLEALNVGNTEEIEGYFYKDFITHINKFSDHKFTAKEFINEVMVPPIIQNNEFYDSKGIEYFYNIEHPIGGVSINEYRINGYLTTSHLVLNNKSEIDTTIHLTVTKGSKTEVIGMSNSLEKVLSYKFSSREIETILDSVYEGGYNQYVLERNQELLNNSTWKLEAFGADNEHLLPYEKNRKSAISKGYGNLPDKMKFSDIKESNVLEVTTIAGNKSSGQYSPFQLDSLFFRDFQSGKGINYKINESGIGLFYLDLYITYKGEPVLFTYRMESQL